MKVRVLGTYGGELGPFRNSAYLLEDSILLDAGGASAALGLAEVLRLEACVLTHAHLDHVASIPFLLDARHGCPPLDVYATAATLEALEAHIFNGRIWPDFRRIPDPKNPLLRYRAIDPGREFAIGALRFRAVAVDHTIPTVGYLVTDGRATVAFSGDTGPTRRLWEEAAAATPGLRAAFVEVSFPARLAAVARQSKHLSTADIEEELRKLPPGTPVYLTHVKPAFAEEVVRELAPALARAPHVRLAEQGAVYEL